jgi:hypothetical protein
MPRALDGLERGDDSPEGASIPERGGVSLKGASSPRARQSFARGGIQPSSEAEFRWYGAGPLERGGDLPEGCPGRPLDGSLRLPRPWAPPVTTP